MAELIANFFLGLPTEIYTSLIVMIIMAVFFIIVGNNLKKADPLKPVSNIVFIGEYIYKTVNNFILSLGSNKLLYLGPYVAMIGIYIPLSFVTGLFGLAGPVNYYAVPLILAFTTFVIIHATSIRYSGWAYFKRFISPTPILLPINLLTFFAPVLSLSFRMFGNALAGTIIMGLVYWSTENLSNLLLSFLPISFNFIGPLVAPFLHMYFDLFSALIQTVVFLSLSILFISAEIPS